MTLQWKPPFEKLIMINTQRLTSPSMYHILLDSKAAISWREKGGSSLIIWMPCALFLEELSSGIPSSQLMSNKKTLL